jgi:hypothetical protein
VNAESLGSMLSGDPMAETNWFQIGASVLGGGAAGAVIASVVTAVRSRKQPIGYRVDVVPVFKGTLGESDLCARLIISGPSQDVKLDNLFLAEVQLVNRGNTDFAKLEMGITLSGGDRAVHLITISPDRHHRILVSNSPTPAAPTQEIDFQLVPFNRRDSYGLKTYLVIAQGAQEPGTLLFGSPEAVVFTRMPTLTELAAEAASGLTLRVGPMRISFFR